MTPGPRWTHHPTVPIYPPRHPVPSDHTDRNIVIAACIAIFWLVFLGIATYESLLEQENLHKDYFDACVKNAAAGKCPFGYPVSKH